MGTDEMIARVAESLWVGGLAASPLALIVGATCRWKTLRPATRHMLWFAVLASFVSPAIGAWIWTPGWFSTDRLIAAADSVLIDTSRPAQAGSGAPEPIRSGARAERLAGGWGQPPDSGTGRPLPAVASPLREDVRAPYRIGAPVEPSIGALMPRSGQIERSLGEPVETSAVHRAPGGSGGWPSRTVGTPPLSPSPALSGQAGTPPATRPTLDDPAIDAGVSPSAPLAANKALQLGTLRTWLVRMVTVRDAVASLPPVPAAVWICGASIVIALRLWRTLRATLWIQRASPAGPEVQASVRQMGAVLGLSRVPRAVFVDAAVSPMIWCGLRPTLVLPVQLWDSLDEDSRRAVLVHELAHVRRLDHVVCWIEGAIGALYWWHPVVWWARHRLRDEAEYSCDAWVTSLFPSRRRAYASALVVTGSYLSSRSGARGPWLGVASSSSRRLARRITVVMTRKTAPQMSRIGACVAALIVTTGTFVMPGLACPPEDGQKHKEAARAEKHKKQSARKAASAHGEGQSASGPGVTFLGEAPALEAMKARRPGPTPSAAPAPPAPPREPGEPSTAAPRAPGMPGRAGFPESVPVSPQELMEGREPRAYAMSPGKLEAFFELMSRQDVPILVERDDGQMVIWGTEQEHEVFQQFLAIIGDPDDRGAGAKERSSRRERRSEGASERYKAMITELERNRDAMRSAAERAREEADATRNRAEHLRVVSDELKSHAAAVAEDDARRELERAMSVLGSRSSEIETASRSMEVRVSELEQQIESIERRIEEIAEELEESSELQDADDEQAALEAPAPGSPAELENLPVLELPVVVPGEVEFPSELAVPALEVRTLAPLR